MRAPAFQWYAAAYLSDERVMLMTLEEEGIQFRKIMAAAQRGDRETLKQYPWVGRLTMGSDAAQRPPVPIAVRKRIMQASKCAYCGSSYKLELDHIIPWSKGGTHDESNLQCLCKPCNRKKSNKL